MTTLAMRKPKSLSQIDIRVKSILESVKIYCDIVYLGECKMNPEDKHNMDKFSVTFRDSGSNKIESFYFHTGFGNRQKLNSYGDVAVTRPTEASILYCLLSDASCGSMSFKDFCDDLGYNYDSIKDLNLHRSMEQNAVRIKKFFKFAIPALEVALQDY